MYMYQLKDGAQQVEAVLWDGVGLPHDMPEWLRKLNGVADPAQPRIEQEGGLLHFHNIAMTVTATPNSFIVHFDGEGIVIYGADHFLSMYELLPEPEPEPEPVAEEAVADVAPGTAIEESATENDPE